MVNTSLILKAINNSIIKCGGSYQARKIGNTVVITVQDDIETFTYGSISVSFDISKDNYGDSNYCFKSITLDGTTIDYLLENSYRFFENQKEWVIENYGTETWNFLSTYASLYASIDGMEVTSALRNNETLPSTFVGREHERFMEIVKDMPLPNKPFVTLRVVNNLHDNDSINRRVVSDKGHVSTSVGADMDSLNTFADTINCWKILTIVNPNDNVKGMFFGNSLNEVDGLDWEAEFNFLPKQKFTRNIIDEENRIIIQVPRN